MYSRIYRFHNLLTVQIQTYRPFYINYFDREFQGCKHLSETKDIDLRLEIDFPEYRRAGVWNFDHRFRRFFRARYNIEGINKPLTILKFASDASFYLYPLVMSAFLQTMLVEPLIYLKGLSKGFLLIHSACIEQNGKGTIVSAVGGGGKTTLALRLANSGFGFLGDDLTFVNPKGWGFAYPRPLHLFTYVTKHLDFLQIDPKVALIIRFKDVIRAVISRVLRQRFLISTRVDFSCVMPHAKITSETELENLIILNSSGLKERLDIGNDSHRKNVRSLLIQNGEINEILKKNLIHEQLLREWADEREAELIDQFLSNMKRIYLIDPRKVGIDEILELIEG